MRIFIQQSIEYSYKPLC